ncbi:IS3 family transposase [Paenibacillus caui]|nr:IS3 family transposase [Paenibacillus caui]
MEKHQNFASAKRMVGEYMAFYNERRFQKKLGDLSPVEYRQQIAA